ncbi:MAG: hypothetical protein U0670_05065 [Anaerolineae bacterium]
MTITRDPQQDEIAIFNYDVTFDSTLLGEFTDPNRNLHLVVDQEARLGRSHGRPPIFSRRWAAVGFCALIPSFQTAPTFTMQMGWY